MEAMQQGQWLEPEQYAELSARLEAERQAARELDERLLAEWSAEDVVRCSRVKREGTMQSSNLKKVREMSYVELTAAVARRYGFTPGDVHDVVCKLAAQRKLDQSGSRGQGGRS